MASDLQETLVLLKNCTIANPGRSPALPFELIEDALDFLWHDPHYSKNDIKHALYNCSLTCRALVWRSRHLLFLRVSGDRHVYDCLIALSSHVPSPEPFLDHTRDLTLSGLRSKSPYSQLFITDLSPWLSCLERLLITYSDWRGGVLTDSFFKSLTSLTSLSSLSLRRCSFSHVYDFDRLVCALPVLKTLKLSAMWWSHNAPGVVNMSYDCPLQLDSLWIEGTPSALLWYLSTAASTSLHTLTVILEEEDAFLQIPPLKMLLDRLGSSLNVLHLGHMDESDVNHQGLRLLSPSLARNTHLKTLTLSIFPISILATYLAQITCTQLSTLTFTPYLPGPEDELHSAAFDKSAWNEIQNILLRPIFKKLARIVIIFNFRTYLAPNFERRHNIRQLYGMLPTWLAKLRYKRMLRIKIQHDMWQEQDKATVDHFDVSTLQSWIVTKEESRPAET